MHLENYSQLLPRGLGYGRVEGNKNSRENGPFRTNGMSLSSRISMYSSAYKEPPLLGSELGVDMSVLSPNENTGGK